MKKPTVKKRSLLFLGAIFLCFAFLPSASFFALPAVVAARTEYSAGDFIENSAKNTPTNSAVIPLENSRDNSRKNSFPIFEKISSFSTWYSQKDGGRCANIAIAAGRIDGVILQPYGEFSFNQTVGKRARSAGFQQAKIIVNGEYVLGVGGGVCQVSTTLYNAALLAGLKVEEAHPHTLQVSYAPPSRDAMVSSESDLKLFNPYSFPVKFSLKAKDGTLTACLFGEPIKETYKIVSVEKGSLPPPPPVVVDSQSEIQERESKDGLISEAYLERYQNGILISRTLLRKDRYAPQPAIVKKIADTTKKIR